MWTTEDEEEVQFWEWWDSGEEEDQRKYFKEMFGNWKISNFKMQKQKADKGIEKIESEEHALARIFLDWIDIELQRGKKGKWK